MMTTGKMFAVPALVLILWAGGSLAGDFKAGAITVTDPWARATASRAKTGAAYLTLRNSGADPDRLIAVKSGVSRKTGLHQSLVESGIMKMQGVRAIDVPAKGQTMLKPGGFHVMFMGLKAPLKEGASFPLSLVFDKAGEITVTVRVMKAGAMGSMKMGHGK